MIKEEPVIFRNKRGKRLSGVLHLPAQKRGVPVIILAHGFTDDKTGDNRLFVKFGRYAARKGFAVLRFDFFGSGESEGDFSEMTVESEVEDLRGAIDFVYTLPQLNEERVHLVGYSLGGAISIIVAADDLRVKSFSGWAPAIFLPKVFGRVLGKKAFSSSGGRKKIACSNGGKQFFLNSGFLRGLERHDLISRAQDISPRLISFAQGTLDKKILPQEALRAFKALEGPKKIHFIKGAGHSFAYFEKELFGWTLKNIKRCRG